MIYSKKGGLVRILYMSASLLCWLLTLGGRLYGARKIILCYHGITSADASRFKKQMEMVKKRIKPRKNNDKLKNSFSAPYIVITFDDAFENLLPNVIPIINELEIPISIYAVTRCMGAPPSWLQGTGHKDETELLMSKTQIKELSLNPLVEIGSHTHSHFRLTSLSKNDIEIEVCESKNILEDIIGTEVDSLAFPHGEYTKEICEIAQQAGFKQVLTLNENLCLYNVNKKECGRFSMEPSVWPIEFRLTVDGAYAWLYYFRKSIRAIKKVWSK